MPSIEEGFGLGLCRGDWQRLRAASVEGVHGCLPTSPKFISARDW